jgi:hypothetical protein
MTMRPTGLGSGIDKDRADCLHRRVEVGRIYQTRGGPDSLRWFWSLTVGRRTRRGGDRANQAAGICVLTNDLDCATISGGLRSR